MKRNKANIGSRAIFSPLRFSGILAISLAILCPISPSYANEALLGGRAFSDPDQVIPMGDAWEAKGITYTFEHSADLAVTLDQQLYPALLPLIEAFSEAKNVNIAVQNGTCGTSAGALSGKNADMGGFCCPPGITDRLPGLKYHTIGIGALALITHPSTPVKNVSLADARKLFGNDIRDWSELPMSGYKPGENEPVSAITRLHCKTRPGHWRLILDSDNDFGWNITDVSAIDDMIRQVASAPGAIGYETLWHIQRLQKERGDIVHPISVNGFAATDEAALAQGKYPLYRVFNITTWDAAPAHSELGDQLAAYLLERAGDLPKEFAFVPHSRLRENGWKFAENELIGQPD